MAHGLSPEQKFLVCFPHVDGEWIEGGRTHKLIKKPYLGRCMPRKESNRFNDGSEDSKAPSSKLAGWLKEEEERERKEREKSRENAKVETNSANIIETGFPFLAPTFTSSKSCVMTDRRRINGPPGGTRPAVYASLLQSATGAADRAQRQRQPTDLRKICMDLQRT